MIQEVFKLKVLQIKTQIEYQDALCSLDIESPL